jgi:hypothetical protein
MQNFIRNSERKIQIEGTVFGNKFLRIIFGLKAMLTNMVMEKITK